MRTITTTAATAVVLLGLAATPAQADDLDPAGFRWNADGTTTLLAQVPGGTVGMPMALNDNNVAVGYVDLGSGGDLVTHAARWDAAGTVTDLGVLPGDANGQAVAVNADGVTIGTSSGQGHPISHAIMWAADGTSTWLVGLPGNLYTWARAIADDGTVVGESDNHAVRWAPDGTPTALPLPAGTTGSGAEMISNSGWIAGFADLPDGRHIVRWNPAGVLFDLGAPVLWAQGENTVVDLAEDGSVVANSERYVGNVLTTTWADRWDPAGTLTELPRPAGVSVAYSTAMNDSGVVSGYLKADHLQPEQPVRWNADGTLTALQNPCTAATAVTINNDGVAVGVCDSHAVRWGADGTMTYLVDPNDFHNTTAVDINAGGNVLGYQD